MHFASGKGTIKTFSGKTCSWSGTLFEGSSRDVFWGRYIEPFLEDCTERLIDLVVQESDSNKLNLKLELYTLSNHMRGLFARIYNEMAEADQRMLGMGHPNQIDRKDVTQEIISMNHYLDQHIVMALNKHKSRTSLKTKFIENFKEQAVQKLVEYSIVAIISILGWIFASEHIAAIINSLRNNG